LVRDVVVCGLNQPYVALLVWPNLISCADLCGQTNPEAITRSTKVIEAIRNGFRAHNMSNSSSSKRIDRFILLQDPPDPGFYEITDKGYINQAAVQEHRHEEVARLFQGIPVSAVHSIADRILR
jgi:feruloyl-CoA synthase